VARAIWTGSLSFGLVNIPVGLFSATEDKTVHFHQFERGTPSRIRYRRVNEDTGKEVDYKNIVKGADIGGGDYVLLTPEELEEVEPGRSRTIDIVDFVKAEEIDPIYYQKTYYIAPNDDGATRAYALLLKAMEKADRVGIATFVMRSKQYLTAIRPQSKVLTLETMYFADEVRDPRKELDRLPESKSAPKKDLDTAVSLIESMTTSWDPTNYRDNYRDRVNQLIKAKAKDEEIVTDQEPDDQEKVVDLVEALQASVERARSHKAGRSLQEPKKLSTRKKGEGSGAKGRASSDGVSRDDLKSLSKQELTDLAQELDISGRSRMSRDDLVSAITEAQSEARSEARSKGKASKGGASKGGASKGGASKGGASKRQQDKGPRHKTRKTQQRQAARKPQRAGKKAS
jgi:DNA end-binding protein Ku